MLLQSKHYSSTSDPTVGVERKTLRTRSTSGVSLRLEPRPELLVRLNRSPARCQAGGAGARGSGGGKGCAQSARSRRCAACVASSCRRAWSRARASALALARSRCRRAAVAASSASASSLISESESVSAGARCRASCGSVGASGALFSWRMRIERRAITPAPTQPPITAPSSGEMCDGSCQSTSTVALASGCLVEEARGGCAGRAGDERELGGMALVEVGAGRAITACGRSSRSKRIKTSVATTVSGSATARIFVALQYVWRSTLQVLRQCSTRQELKARVGG